MRVLPRFAFYGGKGGVGKTTCAAARAVVEASRLTPAAKRRGRGSAPVLVVSTDPAHSLGDALGTTLSSVPRQVTRGLHAVELDAPRAFTRWIRDHRRALGDILEHGTWLDAEDVDALLELSFPGVDELVGLTEIARLAAGRATYDLIVVDTAPTGHTLRLLAAPETVGVVASVLDALQEEHRLIRDRLARVARGPEAADRLITMLASQAAETAERLRDRRQTSFHWVTLPEILSVDESLDAMNALERAGIQIGEVVVNRVLPDAPPCRLCDRRRMEEQRVLAIIGQRLGRRRTLRLVQAEIGEPRGVAALAKLGRHMTRNDRVRPEGRPAKAHPQSGRAAALNLPTAASGIRLEDLDVIKGARLLFFGGKGGVGKTTVAAATALRLARAAPAHQVLLLSTDPAHSLADVLGASVSDVPKPVRNGPKNLLVREVDAPRALAAKRGDLEAAMNQIAAAFGTGTASTGADRAAELMNLAPPGIDELFGIISVVDARDAYRLIVVDTAPTGHALRLLEMPDAAREWTQALLRVLLKYRGLVRPGQLAEELVALAKSVRELQALLRDPVHTRFITVTRAAEVPRLETERLLERLRRLHLSTPAVVVNAMTRAPGACVRCRATAAAERRSLIALKRTLQRSRRRLSGCVIIETPLSAPPPRRVSALESWSQRWIAEKARGS